LEGLSLGQCQFHCQGDNDISRKPIKENLCSSGFSETGKNPPARRVMPPKEGIFEMSDIHDDAVAVGFPNL